MGPGGWGMKKYMYQNGKGTFEWRCLIAVASFPGSHAPEREH